MAKSTVIVLAKLTVTCLLLFLVLRHLELAEIAARIQALSPLPLLAAIVVMGLQLIGVVSWRWRVILAAMAPDLAPRGLIRIVTSSLLFNQLLPSTVGGDGMRAWLLHRSGVMLGLAARSVIIDRVTGFFALMMMAFVGASLLLVQNPQGVPIWLAFGLSAVGMACIAGAPVLLRLFAWVPIKALRQNLETLAREVGVIARDRPLLLRIILVSLIGHSLLTLAAWFTALSLGVQFSLGEAFLILPSVLLISAVPISIAGWGLREGGMVVGLALLGVATGDAALVSIFFGLLMLLYGVLGGLVWLLQRSPLPDGEDNVRV